MMKKTIRLSEAEWTVMQVLWDEPPKTLMQITHALSEQKNWAKTTVMTLLNRMEAKGAVRWEEGGRARRYFPTVDRDAISLQETKGFLERVYQGSVGSMVNSLIEDKALSKEEIDELYDILRKAEENL